MVYGRIGAKTVIALICPKKFAMEAIAKEKGITGAFDELCKHEVVVEAVAKSCLQACKEGKLEYESDQAGRVLTSEDAVSCHCRRHGQEELFDNSSAVARRDLVTSLHPSVQQKERSHRTPAVWMKPWLRAPS